MRRVVFVTALLFAACSDTESTSPGFLPIPPPTTPASGLSARDVQLLGSWEVSFNEVAPEGGGGGALPATPRPTLGNRARLDIRGTTDARISAVMTPRWGRRAPFSMVLVDYERLTIEEHDSRSIPSFSAGNELNKWEKLTLPRAPDGSLVGTFKAAGFMEVTNGPNRASFVIEGSGFLKHDDLAPEMRIAPPAIAQGDKYFPWDRITLDLAEPTLLDAVSKELASAFPNVKFSAVEQSGIPRPETTGFYGTSSSFALETRKLAIEPQTKDPSGNVFAPFNADFVVHELGTPTARHDFDAATDIALMAATRIADARCEKGGCIYFPPAVQTACAPGFAAGFLTTTVGKTRHFKARVRVLASDAPDAEGSLNPPELLAPIHFRIAQPAFYGAMVSESHDFKLVRTGSEELPWESPWLTMDVNLTQTATGDKVGFQIFRAVCEYAAIPKVKDVKVAFLIDDVWSE